MKRLARLFKALSDETRLRILNLLFLSGELCVCDIESNTGLSQTKVSRHLAYLKNAGLLDDRRQGLWMLYSIAKPQSKEQKQLLRCVKTILQNNEVAVRDVKLLTRNIRNGCCSTFAVIKPELKPAVLEPH